MHPIITDIKKDRIGKYLISTVAINYDQTKYETAVLVFVKSNKVNDIEYNEHETLYEHVTFSKMFALKQHDFVVKNIHNLDAIKNPTKEESLKILKGL